VVLSVEDTESFVAAVASFGVVVTLPDGSNNITAFLFGLIDRFLNLKKRVKKKAQR
jgi:hypothetical protein